MNLLAACLYDPAVAVTKATSALLAMTAIDTTNLRNTFTVPPSGRVRVRMVCTIHGATTFPAILLGVLNGAAVVARVAPLQDFANTATAFASAVAEFIVTGLTPAASLTWDAAYGVETIVAATGIKYGGPNNTTANDAWGGFAFEVWDPSPIYTPSAVPATPISARVDTVQTTDTAIKAKTDSLTFTTALKVDAALNAAADLPQAAADKVWSTAARTLTAQADPPGTTTLLTRVPAVVPVASDYTPARAAKLDNLDAAVSSRSTVTTATIISAVSPPTRRRVVDTATPL